MLGFVRQQDSLLPHLTGWSCCSWVGNRGVVLEPVTDLRVIHFKHQTVRETLGFAAALRLPRSVSDAERTAIVEQTIQELGLKDAADTIVGGALRKGISGGERRRLSIGCILVTLPSILILDE